MTVKFLWNCSKILIRIQMRNFSGKYIRWTGFWSEFWNSTTELLWNVSRIWTIQELDDHGILVKFFKDLIKFFSIIRWPQNSCEILPGFDENSSSITRPWNSSRILIRILLSDIVSNNSNDYEILQKLDDHRILFKFFQDLIRIFQEIDDHRILMKFFKDFYQNSCG